MARRLQADEDVPSRYVCTFAQQAAEKALKAALIAEQGDVLRTHDLVGLDDVLKTPIGVEVTELAALGDWGAKSRYPDNWTEPTHEKAARALAIAEEVVVLVTRRLGIEERP